MNDSYFLIELLTRKIAEHVLTSEWCWKYVKLLLDWWSPTVRCCPKPVERNYIWIWPLGMLKLWSQKVFKVIRSFVVVKLKQKKKPVWRIICVGLGLHIGWFGLLLKFIIRLMGYRFVDMLAVIETLKYLFISLIIYFFLKFKGGSYRLFIKNQTIISRP